MGTSVNQILYNAMKDGSRNTHYRVIAQIPDVVTKAGPSTSIKDIDILAKSVTIPQIEHTALEVKIRGHNVPVPGKTDFSQNFSITFYSDDKQQLRDTFFKWIIAIDPSIPTNSTIDNGIFSINPAGSFIPKFLQNTSGSEGLTSTFKVQNMDFMSERVLTEYTFDGVFPISVEGFTYDGSGVSAIQEFTVNFKYQSYAVVKSSGVNDIAGDMAAAAMSVIGDKAQGLVDKASSAIGGTSVGKALGIGKAGPADKTGSSGARSEDIFDGLLK